MTSSPSAMYCDTRMDNYIEHCEDRNVYQMIHQNPNYNVHGGVYSPEHSASQVYPALIPEGSYYETVHGQIIYENSHFYENISHYNSVQYTPLTPDPVSSTVFRLEARPKQNHTYMGKKHRAQITILPSSKGTFKAVVKRKRKRTVFTTEQLEALEQIFKSKQYITREERQIIVNNLQLNDKAVKIWFQNRRLKTKRMQDQDSEDQEDYPTEYTNEERNSPEIARLDSVESEILQRTDKFGFVTLDDGVMGDLVTVIDEFLTKSNLDVPVEELTNDCSPVYEPISPASITDSSEQNSVCWRPSEPNESLQRLFDLQTMLL